MMTCLFVFHDHGLPLSTVNVLAFITIMTQKPIHIKEYGVIDKILAFVIDAWTAV